MFKQPQTRATFDEGAVTTVDALHFICTVKTLDGKFITGVRWLLPIGGGDLTPSVGDAVIVSRQFGYPLILGRKPNFNPPGTIPSADTGVGGAFITNADSANLGGSQVQPDKLTGLLQRDLIWRRGQSFFGMFRTGSFIVKVHSLAQILISKLDQSVRIVARNYERFSDWGDEIVTNYFGRTYRFLGFNRSTEASQAQDYEYYEIMGDTVAGEAVKGQPFSTSLDPKLPANGNVIVKEVLLGAGYSGGGHSTIAPYPVLVGTTEGGAVSTGAIAGYSSNLHSYQWTRTASVFDTSGSGSIDPIPTREIVTQSSYEFSILADGPFVSGAAAKVKVTLLQTKNSFSVEYVDPGDVHTKISLDGTGVSLSYTSPSASHAVVVNQNGVALS